MRPAVSCLVLTNSHQKNNSLCAKVRSSVGAVALFLLMTVAVAPHLPAQPYDPALYSGMQWRQIGPFRAGRVTAVTGVAGRPATYYMGTAGGGAWKTVDGGMVWKPIFDQQHIASIGAM